MICKPGPTAERLRELMDYDPETGVFTRRISTAHSVKAGDIAGSIDRHGYKCIMVDLVPYKAHRLPWLYVHGVWPDLPLDHINRIRGDNRIANLREATIAENNQNTKIRKDNISGYRGVYWHKANQLWVAQISAGGKKKYLGCFRDPEAAHQAYVAAAAIHHTHNHGATGASS